MNQLLERIGKARARGAALDLDALASRSHGRSPEELTSPAQLARRRQFLSESLGDEREAKKVFERIILGNELQDANYLARGARAAEAVARIAIHEPAGRQLGWGTGFLIGPGLLSRVGAECRKLKLGARCAIISDRHVAPRYAKAVIRALKAGGFDPFLITVPAG